MKKSLKWVGIVFGGLVILILLTASGVGIYGISNFKPVYKNRPMYPITANTSPEGIARGKYLTENVMSCNTSCHSEYGTPYAGGSEKIKQGPVDALLSVPNITQDQETGIGDWSDAAIARAIREGVDDEGEGLVVMPSAAFRVMSDEDVAAMIGYLRTIKPVKNAVPPMEASAATKVMFSLGLITPPEVTQPITQPVVAPQHGTVEYGHYLVTLGACRDCHGAVLQGGPMPIGQKGPHNPSNLTPAGDVHTWTQEEFNKAMRQGIDPEGATLSDFMPKFNMNDQDLVDLFAYLKSLPPKAERK